MGTKHGDPFGGSSISPRERDERVVREAVRQVKLEAKNDATFVPPANDVSLILAARHYVLPTPMPFRAPEDAQDVLAQRIYGAGRALGAGTGTPVNIPWTLVQRDSVGHFSAGLVQVTGLQGSTVGSYDFVLYKPDGTTPILRVPTTTTSLEVVAGFVKFIPAAGRIVGGSSSLALRDNANANDNLFVTDAGDVTVRARFGCNGKAAQASVTAGSAAGGGTGGAGGVSGTAGATYTATEQTLLNDCATAINAMAGIINAQAGQITALATLANTMRTALIANGVLV